jgi:hypothetical protein
MVRLCGVVHNRTIGLQTLEEKRWRPDSVKNDLIPNSQDTPMSLILDGNSDDGLTFLNNTD